MSGDPNQPTISLQEKSLSPVATGERLSKWLLFSFIFHFTLLIALFISPYFPTQKPSAPPIYTVDLVGGEKIGGNNSGTRLQPTPPPKELPKKVMPQPPLPAPETKKEVPKAKEKIEKIEKIDKIEKVPANEKAEKVTKKVEKAAPVEEKVAPREPVRREIEKSEPTKDTKTNTPPEERSADLDKVREKLIQSAVDRVKSRAESAQKSAVSKGGDALSVGPGEGEGAIALGQGGRGGGTVVKGVEFIAYQNSIVSTIKQNWAWPGQKGSLKALVRFGIKDNGEIIGIKIAEPSGDPAFDESILRALRKSSPLPSPPESYRKDFSQVEMNFQP